jgi:hypothetical protein
MNPLTIPPTPHHTIIPTFYLIYSLQFGIVIAVNFLQ